MIYLSFIVWLILIIFVGAGTFRLWVALVKPAYVNWALLPGTVVSEMAYIFGCLITGGEIRRAKLIDSPKGPKGDGPAKAEGGGKSASGTDASGGLKIVGPIVASLLAIVACAAAILAVGAYLGEPVTRHFDAALPKDLPDTWSGFWTAVKDQVDLLRKTCEAWTELDWANWRVPVFVYAAICLSLRLAPARRDLRSTLAAVVVIAAALALAGAVSERFKGLMQDLWPLLTYVWASLLFLLFVTLIVRGVAGLVRALAGKKAG